MHHSSPRRDPLSSDRFLRVDSGDPREDSNAVSSSSTVAGDTSSARISFVFGHEVRVPRTSSRNPWSPPITSDRLQPQQHLGSVWPPTTPRFLLSRGQVCDRVNIERKRF